MNKFFKSLAFSLLLISSLTAAGAVEPTKVAIGYPPATDFLAAYVAKDEGFFAKHNIDATLVKIPVVTNIPSSVVSGSMPTGGRSNHPTDPDRSPAGGRHYSPGACRTTTPSSSGQATTG